MKSRAAQLVGLINITEAFGQHGVEGIYVTNTSAVKQYGALVVPIIWAATATSKAYFRIRLYIYVHSQFNYRLAIFTRPGSSKEWTISYFSPVQMLNQEN